MQINLRYSMGSKVHFVGAIRSSRAERHEITTERFTDAELAAAESDVAIGLDFPQLVYRVVFDRWQRLGERARTRLITARRHRHFQSFMRPHVIVAVAPFIKPGLHPGKVSEDSLGQHLDFQGAMKAFVFALRLRMIRATMRNSDAQPQQPHREWRVLMCQVVAPRRAVVHQHPLGQAVTAKSGRQLLLHRVPPLIPASLQAERITRVIVQHGQRMTAFLIAQTKVSLKIHLPELVRSLLLESLERPSRFVRRITHSFMPPQNRVDGALCQGSVANSLQTRFDLARTPAVLITHCQHLLLECWLAAPRRMLRSARLIGQTSRALFSIPPAPLVAGLPADTETPAQFTEIASRLLRQFQKLLSQSHGQTLLPRHVVLLTRSSCHCLLCYPCLRTPVTYVPGLYTQRERAMRKEKTLSEQLRQMSK